MRIKIAIIDRNIQDCEKIKELISSTKISDLEIEDITVPYLNNLITSQSLSIYDFVFIGISSANRQLFEFIEKTTSENPNLQVILMSDEIKYALFGYEIGVSDYILKTISYKSFKSKFVNLIRKMYKRQNPKKILVKSRNNGTVTIDIDSISYVEISNHDLIFHLEDKEIIARGTMKEIESQLSQYNFAQCNSCYLVNLSKVDCVLNDYVKIENESLKISQGKKKTFMDALNR